MGSLSTGNVTVNYSVNTSNNKTVITIDSITASSTSFSPPKKGAKKYIYVKVDGANFVNVTAKWNKKASSSTKARARTDAVLVAITTANSKRDLGQASFSFDCGAKDVNKVIKLCVFGRYKSEAVKIPKAVATTPDTPVPTDPFDTNDVDETNKIKKYVTIASVNNGEVFLTNPAAMETYGRIEKVVDWSDETDPAKLKRLAEIYLSEQQFDDLVLSVSAIDLHGLMGEVPAFNLLDQVYCYSYPHGMETTMPITEMTIKLDQADSEQYTLGQRPTSKAMSSKAATSTSNVSSKIENIPSPKDTLANAKNLMTRILNQRTTGYVNIVEESEHSQAIVISDDEDWTRSAKLWKWDMNGLGYSDSEKPVDAEDYEGPVSSFGNRTYKTGITMDGHIVADFLDVGVIEDGMGYNHWNLETGDFQIRGDTAILNLVDGNEDEDLTKVSTLAELIDKTSSSELIAKRADSKSSTSGNLLRATNNFSVMDKASWDDGGWAKTGQGFVNIADIESKPNPELFKMVRISTTGAAYTTEIYQTDVPVEPNTVYVMSCWIKGAGELKMRAGVKGPYRQASVAVPEAGSWHRYQLVFKTSASGQETIDVSALSARLHDLNLIVAERNLEYWVCNRKYKTAKNVAHGKNSKKVKAAKKRKDDAKKEYLSAKADADGVQAQINSANQTAYITANNKISIYFGNCGNGILDICGMTLARGNESTDWSTSDTDARSFVENITEDDRAFTKSQLEALDASNNQSKIFSRLTRNGAAKGMFMKNNELYINATYIYASSMVTDLLRTNLIADANQKSVWNLATGYFKTKNMEAENMRAEGTFQGGKTSDYHVDFSGQGITSYPPSSNTADTYIGFVRTYNAQSRKFDIANLSLQSRNTIQLYSPNFIVSRESFKKINGSYAGGEAGVTKTITIKAVVGTKTSKKTKKKVMNKRTVAKFRFVNGICVYAK